MKYCTVVKRDGEVQIEKSQFKFRRGRRTIDPSQGLVSAEKLHSKNCGKICLVHESNSTLYPLPSMSLDSTVRFWYFLVSRGIVVKKPERKLENPKTNIL